MLQVHSLPELTTPSRLLSQDFPKEMPPVIGDCHYLGTSSDGGTPYCERTHCSCHGLGWVSPNVFTVAASQCFPATTSDTRHLCHAHTTPSTASHMTFNENAFYQNPHASAITASAIMHPPTYQGYKSSTAHCAGQSAWSSPFLAGGLGSNADDSASQIPDCVNNKNIQQSEPPGHAEFTPILWHHAECQHQSGAECISSRPTPTTNKPGLFPHQVALSKLGADNDLFSLVAPSDPGALNFSALQDGFYPDIIQQDSGRLGIYRSDNVLGDESLAGFDSWSSPNTFLNPVTPSLTGQSPWTATGTEVEAYGGSALPFEDSQSPHVGHGSGLFGAGTDYISPTQIDLDTALSDYPPLPDLDTPFESSVHFLKNPQIASPGPSLPTWPITEGFGSWLGEDLLRDQRLLNEAVAETPPHNTSMTIARPLLLRGGMRDTSKDEYLVQCKEQGMSYKQIKESGGFGEAESTLRGRYRALTKPREARLRKPEWGQREVSSLVHRWINSDSVGRLTCSSKEFLIALSRLLAIFLWTPPWTLLP